MIKKYILFTSIFISIIIILSSCGPSTDLVGEWSEDEYKTNSIDKLLVLGIFDKEKPLLRRRFEDGISQAFNDSGIEAVPSMDIMSYKEEIDSAAVEKHFVGKGFDAVIVSRLVGLDKERKVQAGYAYTIPYGNYYGFYGYYYAAVQYANTSSYLSKNLTVVLETNLYNTDEKKLIWSGISETIDPSKASEVIGSLGKVLVDKLDSEGFLAN
ncbi:MAG: hypothetical protein ACW99A_10535 [Candidatus Kariarchaeaceae archaeon]|jgi:hypothetical protein